ADPRLSLHPLMTRQDLAAGGAEKKRRRRHAAPKDAIADAGLDQPDALNGRVCRRRKGWSLRLLPLFGRIVGMEEVRAELTVCDRREIAAAPPIARGELHRLAREGAPGDLERTPGAAAQNH